LAANSNGSNGCRRSWTPSTAGPPTSPRHPEREHPSVKLASGAQHPLMDMVFYHGEVCGAAGWISAATIPASRNPLENLPARLQSGCRGDQPIRVTSPSDGCRTSRWLPPIIGNGSGQPGRLPMATSRRSWFSATGESQRWPGGGHLPRHGCRSQIWVIRSGRGKPSQSGGSIKPPGEPPSPDGSLDAPSVRRRLAAIGMRPADQRG